MKLSNHSAVAIRAAALVLLLGAASPLTGQTTESPSGKMLTQAGVDSIVDSIGAVWTLGPRDPLIDGGVYPTKARNGVIDGSAAVLCYSGRSVNARGDLADGWWKWTDDATLLLKGSWSSVSTTPIGCVVASAADTTPPTVPTGLVAVAISPIQIRLTWNPSTDNVGVTGYIVRRNGVQIATPATTSFVNTGLSAATTYSYTVAARDAAGNISPDSASVNVTTASAADTTPPTTPTGLSAAAAGSTGANLSWSASTDNVGVTGYIVRRNGVQIATPATTSFANTGLSAATTYSYTVAARDAAGNISPNSTSVSVTTPTPPPSNSASLAWDSVTVPNLSGYRIYFGTAPGTYLQSPGQGFSVGNVTDYTMIGLASGSRYYFAVTAFDTLSQESPYSNEVFKDIP